MLILEEFIQIMEEASRKDLSEFFDWNYGEGFPNYKIRYAQADGGVIVRINQLPSHSSVDFFEMPIPLRLLGEESDTTVVVDNVIQDQTYFLKTEFLVNSLEFDPDRRILAFSEIEIDP